MSIKAAINAAAPAIGWRDTFIRAAKSAITTGVAVAGTNLTGYTDLTALKGAAIVGLGAAFTIVLNKVLSWAASP